MSKTPLKAFYIVAISSLILWGIYDTVAEYGFLKGVLGLIMFIVILIIIEEFSDYVWKKERIKMNLQQWQHAILKEE